MIRRPTRAARPTLRRFAAACVLALGAASVAAPAVADPEPVPGAPTMQRVKSPFSGADTLTRVEAALTKRGLTIFDGVDHEAAARGAGREMPFTSVVIFGNPKVGTGAMLKSPTIAIDLPLKALVYEDKDGAVWFAFSAPEHMSGIYTRHGLGGGMDWYQKLMTGLAADVVR